MARQAILQVGRAGVHKQTNKQTIPNKEKRTNYQTKLDSGNEIRWGVLWRVLFGIPFRHTVGINKL